MPKAQRMFKGIAFCAACYAREFHRVPCVKCNEPCRKHFSAYEALCRQCVIDDRRCQRCERPVPRAALIVNDKPVCPSCRRYFRPTKTYKPIGHASCRVCRKYRFAVSRDEKGRPICRLCSERDRTAEVKASYDAYWRAAAAQKARLAGVEINQAWVSDLWDKFAATEIAAGNANVFALKAKRHIDFFVRLDAVFEFSAQITGLSLCDTFSVEDLRRYTKPLAFLESQGFEIPSQAEKIAAAESARIRRMLLSVRRHAHAATLTGFAKQISAVNGNRKQAQLSTVRLSLRPAIGLIEVAGAEPISQAHVDRYLRAHPGQRAALSRFVVYLRGQGFVLTLPPQKRPAVRRATAIPPIERWTEAARSAVFGEAASAILALLMHGLGARLALLLAMERSAIAERDSDLIVSINNHVFTPDAALASALRAYLRTRDNKFGDAGMLFPGRHRSQSMSPPGVDYHLKRWGVKAAAISGPTRLALKIHATAETSPVP